MTKVVLRDDIFEASHIYRLQRLEKFLAVIEAKTSSLLDKVLTALKLQAGGRRYYKAYLADQLDGSWMPLATRPSTPFASPANVREVGPHWTDSFSHGEFLRAGYDEKLEVDPADLRFLFQGASEQDRQGKRYGEIPWRLGMLEPFQ